jgi:hypothetical protein
MVLFLGLRAEEPEELYPQNPVLKARADTGSKRKLPNDERIVIFVLHKPRLK